MLQVGKSWVRLTMRSLILFFSAPNPSNLTMVPEFTQLLTEMSTRSRKVMFWGSRARPVHKADNLNTIYEPIVCTMLDP
jgi:hypothetical protein